MSRLKSEAAARNARRNRRVLLRTAGAGCAALLAGCLGGNGGRDSGDDRDDGDSSDDAASTDEPSDGAESADGRDVEDGDTASERPTPEIDPSDLAFIDLTDRGLIRLTGGGEDLSGTADEGHYYYDEVRGDFDVAVHCVDLEPVGTNDWEKCGLMIRASMDAGAPMAMIRRRPDGNGAHDASPTRVVVRSERGVASEVRDGPNAEWLRVRREGDVIAIYGSMTSLAWDRIDTVTVPDDVALSDDVLVGIAVTSGPEVDDTVAATCKDLSGVTPTRVGELGSPRKRGTVKRREDVPVVDTLAPSVGSSSITCNGAITLPDGRSSAECHFEYRGERTGEWTVTEPQTLRETGTFSATVDVDRPRIYQLRAVADLPEERTRVRGSTVWEE